MSASSMRRADNHAFAWAQRKKDGKTMSCIHGLGPTDDSKCAERCRAGNAICHRSGSACAIGALAMSKVVAA